MVAYADGVTDGWQAWALGAVVFVLALVVLVWLSHRSLKASHRDGGASAGTADAFGGLIEAFQPGRAQADRDLQSAKHQGQQFPAPGGDDRPVRVDLDAGTIRINRPGR